MQNSRPIQRLKKGTQNNENSYPLLSLALCHLTFSRRSFQTKMNMKEHKVTEQSHGTPHRCVLSTYFPFSRRCAKQAPLKPTLLSQFLISQTAGFMYMIRPREQRHSLSFQLYQPPECRSSTHLYLFFFSVQQDTAEFGNFSFLSR